MSGIVGTYHRSGAPADPEALRRMTARIAHRGPDGIEHGYDGAVGLGHCMLHTTPESLHEKLPHQSRESGCLITADARIDNRDELMRKLHMGSTDEVVPDSTLILRAYERWGEACVQHLIGAFAFAIWDPNEQTLFCARDHIGIRPFFYHAGDDEVVFASEIKAILASGQVAERCNEQRLIDLLLRTQVDREATVYHGIKRLPPAHTLTATADDVKIRRYWTLTPDEEVGDDWSDEAYTERFRALFRQAVEARTRSTFPVGSDLSGGLDSSAVSAIARDVLKEEGRGPLHTFSYFFDETPESDEREYAEAVLEQDGFAPHWINGDDVGPLTHLDEIYSEVVDDYLVGGMHYMIWESYKAARESGVRVMLNGFDGDTTVSHGLLRLKELAQAGEWRTFAREVMLLAKRHKEADHRHPFEEMMGSVGALFNRFARPELKRLAEKKHWIRFARAARALSTHFTVSQKKIYRWYWRELLLPKAFREQPARTLDAPVTSQILRDEVRRQYDVDERIRQFHAQRSTLFDSVQDKQRAQLSSSGISEGLEVMEHYAAYHGHEVRLPFMDIRLLRFCLALPSAQRLGDGWTRLVLRRAMDGVLPDLVTWRVGKARMFAANKRALLKTDGARLRRYVIDGTAAERYVDEESVRALLEQRDALKAKDFIILQRVATLSAWTDIRFAGRHIVETERAVPSY